MKRKPTYIDIINAFWEKYADSPVRTQAAMVFFYVLNCINRNDWKPVYVSDSKMAAILNVSRFRLPEYKKELLEFGVFKIKPGMKGNTLGTYYELAVAVAKGEGGDAPDGTGRKTGVVPNGSLNASNGSLNASNGTTDAFDHLFNDYIRPLKTFKDRESERTHTHTHAYARNFENFEDSVDREATPETTSGGPTQVATLEGARKTATDRLMLNRIRASEQGKMLIEMFFAPESSYYIDLLCSQNGVDRQQLRRLAEIIVAQWISEGKTHDAQDGSFDISDAMSHLRLSLPKCAASEAANVDSAPGSRQGNREKLTRAMMREFYEAAKADEEPEGDDNHPF